MKKELNANELEQVSGGTVRINDRMQIGFSTLNEAYTLKNCTFREARDFAEDLLAANQTMSNSEFDAFVKQQLIDKGWLNTADVL